jgi:hypothetical protein
VTPERYVVADADTLASVPGSAAESAAEAHERRRRAMPASAALQVVPAREAA